MTSEQSFKRARGERMNEAGSFVSRVCGGGVAVWLRRSMSDSECVCTLFDYGWLSIVVCLVMVGWLGCTLFGYSLGRLGSVLPPVPVSTSVPSLRVRTIRTSVYCTCTVPYGVSDVAACWNPRGMVPVR